MEFYEWQDLIRSENGPRGGSVRLVLLILASWMNKNQTYCWPAQKKVGIRSDLDRTSVNRNLKDAERQGWIVTSYCFPDGSRAKGKVYYAAINGRPIKQSPPRGYSNSEQPSSQRPTEPVANCDTNTYRNYPHKYKNNSDQPEQEKDGFKNLLGQSADGESGRKASDEEKTKALMFAMSMGAKQPSDVRKYLGEGFDLADAERFWEAARLLSQKLSQEAPIGDDG